MESLDGRCKELDEPSKYGLKLLLNHKFSLQSKQIISPRPKQIIDLMPLSARYVKYYFEKKMQKKRPIMDYINMVSAQRMYGCPIGGIGGGTIGRGFKGEFCRFQLYPGIYEYVTVPECQFIVNIRNAKNETIFQSVLSTYDKPKKAPATWEWNLNGADCEYTALYPRAWTTYDLTKYGIKLVCRQISPVIPHNYKDSSLPCAVFVFSAKNVSNEHRDVNIAFTWTEVLAAQNKKKSTKGKVELEKYCVANTCGVSLDQTIGEIPCTFTIAKKIPNNEDSDNSYCYWNHKTSSYVWECLKQHGKLKPQDDQSDSNRKEKPKKICKYDSVALSTGISLDPGGCDSTEFSLVWDMPVIKYKNEKRIHKRFYTKFFGYENDAANSIAAYSLKNYKNWEDELAEWQEPILNNDNIPDWLKSALMNELYFIADGGTIWFDVSDEYPDTDPRHEFGLFGYLEGHEYRMYNTYDVHFYASFALAQLWPNLQMVLQFMYLDAIDMESTKYRQSLYDGKSVKFKIKDTFPHDLGDPDDAPFTNINAYNVHDVSQWRDLGLKFVLQVMRDQRRAARADERYRSLAYIDDVCAGTEDDLYWRSTGQAGDGCACTGAPQCAGEDEGAEGACTMAPLLARGGKERDRRGAPRCAEGVNGASTGALRRAEGAKGACTGALRCADGVEGACTLTPLCRAEGARGEAGRGAHLARLYPACAALVRRAAAWDRDGDGLIENGGFPDQTFDAWVMTGPSAYCGGLWVAALCAVQEMARMLDYEEDEKEFGKMLERARRALDEKLWAGSYYRFDARPANADVVMADQLAGHWYLRASGWKHEVFTEEKVKRALATVYENNVMRFAGGRMGAVNGYVCGERPRVDTSALQSEEVWVGVTYALAALMIYEGMHEQAFVTAGGLYNTLTKMGLSFETPEALYENGNHRSVGYMRPLAVWAMYQALVASPPPPPANGQLHPHTDNTAL